MATLTLASTESCTELSIHYVVHLKLTRHGMSTIHQKKEDIKKEEEKKDVRNHRSRGNSWQSQAAPGLLPPQHAVFVAELPPGLGAAALMCLPLHWACPAFQGWLAADMARALPATVRFSSFLK